MSAYHMVKGLFLSAYDIVNTAWANNPYISIIFSLFPFNSHKFPLIPMESFHLQYFQNFATLAVPLWETVQMSWWSFLASGEVTWGLDSWE